MIYRTNPRWLHNTRSPRSKISFSIRSTQNSTKKIPSKINSSSTRDRQKRMKKRKKKKCEIERKMGKSLVFGSQQCIGFPKRNWDRESRWWWTRCNYFVFFLRSTSDSSLESRLWVDNFLIQLNSTQMRDILFLDISHFFSFLLVSGSSWKL